LIANAVLLIVVLGFVLGNQNTDQIVRQSSAAVTDSTVAANPLDQLSSVDIAVHVARLTRLDEATSVTNQADSVNAQLALSPAGDTVIAKPQIVATALKSKKDITRYVTQAGDNVSGLAARFGVTSDSIRWSNGLSTDTLPVGVELFIPPVNGIVYLVKPGDTVDSLAQKYRVGRDQIIAANDAEVAGLKVGERILIPDGSVTVSRSTGGFGANYAFGYGAVYGYNGYDFGWCTWYVSNRRAAIGRPVPSNLGNAYSWYILAQRAGLPTGLTPAVGAVVVNQGGNHVSVIESVNEDGSFIVSEMNSRGWDRPENIGVDGHQAGGWARIDYKSHPSAGNLKFIY